WSALAPIADLQEMGGRIPRPYTVRELAEELADPVQVQLDLVPFGPGPEALLQIGGEPEPQPLDRHHIRSTLPIEQPARAPDRRPDEVPVEVEKAARLVRGAVVVNDQPIQGSPGHEGVVEDRQQPMEGLEVVKAVGRQRAVPVPRAGPAADVLEDR